MTRPVHLTFRNMRGTDSLKNDIQQRVAWLHRYYPDVIGCRVLVEVPHRHHRHGRHVHVRVEMSLPGETSVATRSDEQASVAVHDAFDAARRRLEDFARRQRGEVKAHAVPA